MSQALLQRNGVEQVDTAENGLQAVLAALSDLQKYDVLFMDNFMPVMVTTQRNYFSQLRGRECYCVVDEQDRLEAVRKLREGGFSKLVVGVTGNALVEDIYVAVPRRGGGHAPVKIDSLKMLLHHVNEHGPRSLPDTHLSEGIR